MTNRKNSYTREGQYKEIVHPSLTCPLSCLILAHAVLSSVHLNHLPPSKPTLRHIYTLEVLGLVRDPTSGYDPSGLLYT